MSGRYRTEPLDWASDLVDPASSTELVQDVTRALRDLEVDGDFTVAVQTMSGPAGWPVVIIHFDRHLDRQTFLQAYFEDEEVDQ